MARSQVGLHVVGLNFVALDLIDLISVRLAFGVLIHEANLSQILREFRQNTFGLVDSTLPRLVERYIPFLLEFRPVRRNELVQFILRIDTSANVVGTMRVTYFPSQLFRQFCDTDIRLPLPKEIPCLVLEPEPIVPSMMCLANTLLVDEDSRTVIRDVVDERGEWVDLQGCADDDEQIAFR